MPPPAPSSPCDDSCSLAHDGDCDDGGPGSEFSQCSLGTDCIDCDCGCSSRSHNFAPLPPLPPAALTLYEGAPPVHIANVRLLGSITVRGGILRITSCRIEACGQPASTEAAAGSALTLSGGHTVLSQSVLIDHPAGAIK
eukprot:3261709-Prymnesium_polylepis.1